MKSIPIQLQSHYDEPVNTTCYLLRIVRNVGFNGEAAPVIGVGSLDVPVTYDDGNGAVIYSAVAGFLPSSVAMSADLSVDNAEAEMLIPAYDLGPIIESEINAGKYDGAAYVMYKVNYKDLTTGRHEIVMSGTIGQNRVVGGLSCFAELRTITQKLRQSVCELDSITCRATFGDARCGVDAEALFVSGTVTSVGSESDRIFTDTSLAAADNYYSPGMVEWLTGENAGLSHEVESNVSDIVTLTFHTRYDIAIGDTYRIRPDCAKRFQTDCITKYANGLNFRGEPFIPVGDEAAIAVPGATQQTPRLPGLLGIGG